MEPETGTETESTEKFKKGDIVRLNDEGKKALGRFLKKDTYEVLMHSKESSPRAEIVTITDDDKEPRDLHASYIELVSKP